MIQAPTEQSDASYRELDLWPTEEALGAMIAVQQQALRGVEAARSSLAAAVDAVAERMMSGGRLVYIGAGSSGLVAQLDALEMPGTYGIPQDRVPVILAGGTDSLLAMQGGAEDDRDAAAAAVDALAVGPGDAVVALAASGSTPFTVAGLDRARQRGALTIGIASVAGSALLTGSHHPVLIETPPEVVAGSTRMAAGTAQKCALNILSTGIAVRLGHAYAGLMVNLNPDNAKLRQRAVGIVAKAAQVDSDTASRALAETDWAVKPAVVMCLARVEAEEARIRLDRNGGDIRRATQERSAA